MEKLAISFWIWGPLDTGDGVYHDCEKRMRELRERGFNCVRMESCAGLLNAPDGTPRGGLTLHAPFGRFTANARQSNVDRWEGVCNVRERLLAMHRAAKNNGVKIILSSWYYLHTNWFLDEAVNAPLFEMPDAEKLAYFGRELGAVLSLLREHDLLDTVAFAELFNEVDGLPFAGTYRNDLPREDVLSLRDGQEKAIAALKADFPEVKFAFDTSSPFCQEELIPRNADVLNFHCYYLWPLYELFQRNLINGELTEPDYPPETRRYMKPESEWVSVAEVVAERGVQRTGLDWNRRCALYENLDPNAFPELEKAMEAALVRDQDGYFAALERAVDRAFDIRNRILPGAPVVMGEGVTYCYHNDLLFEEHSPTYWALLERQMRFLKEKGLSGAVCRTTSGPEDPSWDCRADEYRKLNQIFLAE